MPYLLQACNNLATNQNQDTILSTVTPALVLGLSANRRINLCHRDLLRPHFGKPYQALCNPSVEITTLFGDDLNKIS